MVDGVVDGVVDVPPEAVTAPADPVPIFVAGAVSAAAEGVAVSAGAVVVGVVGSAGAVVGAVAAGVDRCPGDGVVVVGATADARWV